MTKLKRGTRTHILIKTWNLDLQKGLSSLLISSSFTYTDSTLLVMLIYRYFLSTLLLFQLYSQERLFKNFLCFLLAHCFFFSPIISQLFFNLSLITVTSPAEITSSYIRKIGKIQIKVY